MTSNQKQPPVILFGHGRSGTSVIAAKMREHLGVAFGTESQFILSFYQRRSRYDPLEDEQNLIRLVDDLLQERWFQRSRKFNDFGLNRDEIVAAVQERTLAGVCDAIFSLFADHLEMNRWGDKTPDYIHQLDTINELFPTAQYVYVVRDGRDVALSLKHTHFGPKNMYTAAHDWRATVCKGDEFAAKIPPSKLFYIRYEDFLNDPVETFVRLDQFLGTKRDAQSLRTDLEVNLLPEIKQGNSDKWRREYSEKQQQTYEQIAQQELAKHGYDISLEHRNVSSGPLQHVYWRALSELGKWRFPGYWKDNWYKVRLRARRVMGSPTRRQSTQEENQP